MPDVSVLSHVASLWFVRPSPPSAATRARLRSLGLWRPCRVLGSRRDYRIVYRRGRRATKVRRDSSSRCARCDATNVTVAVTGLCPRCSTFTFLSRRVYCRHVTYSSLNIRSLSAKLDGVLEFVCDNKVDIMYLIESWHDTDDVSICRLRASGFNVVDRPRPRAIHNISTNHGGLSVFSASARFASPESANV
jgi:hypothetical protein